MDSGPSLLTKQCSEQMDAKGGLWLQNSCSRSRSHWCQNVGPPTVAERAGRSSTPMERLAWTLEDISLVACFSPASSIAIHQPTVHARAAVTHGPLTPRAILCKSDSLQVPLTVSSWTMFFHDGLGSLASRWLPPSHHARPLYAQTSCQQHYPSIVAGPRCPGDARHK